MSDPTTDVVDDVENDRFLYVEDGIEAQLIYETAGDRLVLIHTEVPDSLGGRGIGGRLVTAAVDRAARSGETVVPWCPYARKWLSTHPDVAGRVSIDWDDLPKP